MDQAKRLAARITKKGSLYIVHFSKYISMEAFNIKSPPDADNISNQRILRIQNKPINFVQLTGMIQGIDIKHIMKKSCKRAKANKTQIKSLSI